MSVRARAAALVLAPALLALGMLAPAGVHAQAGLYVTPSFSLAEVYDDNLFSTAGRRQQDLISRFSPGVEFGYRSAPFTLLGRYNFDAELYVDHPELNAAQARQEAAVQVVARPTQLLTLSLDGAFTETQIPGELNVDTGLATRRVPAQRLSISPAVAYRFDLSTEGIVDYTYSVDEQTGGVQTRTHIGDLRLDRRLTPLDTGSLGYVFRQFTFDGDETETSHTTLLGWTRRLASLTTLALRAGPRFSEDGVDADVLASVRQRLRRGELSLAYARSQTTVIGRAGTVDFDSVTLTATYEPLPLLRLSAAPSVFRVTDAQKAMVYGADLEATYRIQKWLSLTAAYAFRLQRGGVDAGTPRDQEILRNVILLRLTIVYPYRVY